MVETVENWISVDKARAAITSGSGKGVRIAVLDSGIESSHPGLRGLVLEDDLVYDLDGPHVMVKGGCGEDVYGHGTGVAGIITKLVPEARIGSFRVLRWRLFDLTSKAIIIQTAARDAIDRGYKILNCSFGARGDERFIMSFKDWVDEAYVKGVHVVSACNNANFTEREWPAYFPSVVSVDWADIERLDQIFYRPGNLVEFIAKGQYSDLLSRDGMTVNLFGTSFAAPVAAALLARLLSVHPQLSPLGAKELLRLAADPWSEARSEYNDAQQRRRPASAPVKTGPAVRT
jgi:subtilisin family serine protease